MKTYTGKTVDDAVSKACLDLGVTIDQLNYEVTLETKGLFSKKAEIACWTVEMVQEYIENLIRKILTDMQFEVETVSYVQDGRIYCNINTSNNSILIGKAGVILRAINLIIKNAVSTTFKKRLEVSVDINGYKEERYKKVASMARRFGKTVLRTKADLKLDPMPADERKVMHQEIAKMDLDGYAVGGLAVGETHEEMYRILDAVVPYLPQDKPTYLMGVGTPANILEGVDRGIDFFDCVYPSRNGRHGHVYTNHGKMNMFNAKYELDSRPIEEGCGCPACRHYSRAYIRHLLKAKEMLGMRLCVLHNLYFYNHMMEEIRDALDEGRFAEYKKMRLEGFAAGEQK